MLVPLVTSAQPRKVIHQERFNKSFTLDNIDVLRQEEDVWVLSDENDFELFDFERKMFREPPTRVMDTTLKDGSVEEKRVFLLGTKPFFDTDQKLAVLRGSRSLGGLPKLKEGDAYLFVLKPTSTEAAERRLKQGKRVADGDIGLEREDRRVRIDAFTLPPNMPSPAEFVAERTDGVRRPARPAPPSSRRFISTCCARATGSRSSRMRARCSTPSSTSWATRPGSGWSVSGRKAASSPTRRAPRTRAGSTSRPARSGSGSP